MSKTTSIEWCDSTFNPWTGCTQVSPGCDHCYAEGWAKRSGTVQWGPHAERRRTTPTNWRAPLQWHAQAAEFFAAHGRRQRVFCASLADVFDNQVPAQWREDLFELIRQTPRLDWLLLTKRPQNIIRMVREQGAIAGNGSRYLPENVRLGTTAEDQTRANLNLPHLLTTRDELGASNLFVSVEPMLGPVDLTRVVYPAFRQRDELDPYVAYDALRGHMIGPDDVGLAKLDWVICGGESGPGARPMHPDWARSLRDQCTAAGVPFLFKQWGEWSKCVGDEQREHPEALRAKRENHSTAWPDGTVGYGNHRQNGGLGTPLLRVGKKVAGRLLDGREHNDFPRGFA